MSYSKDEFATACKNRGVCSRWAAEKYVKEHPKDVYDEDDVIQAYRVESSVIESHGNPRDPSYYDDDEYAEQDYGQYIRREFRY